MSELRQFAKVMAMANGKTEAAADALINVYMPVPVIPAPVNNAGSAEQIQHDAVNNYLVGLRDGSPAQRAQFEIERKLSFVELAQKAGV